MFLQWTTQTVFDIESIINGDFKLLANFLHNVIILLWVIQKMCYVLSLPSNLKLYSLICLFDVDINICPVIRILTTWSTRSVWWLWCTRFALSILFWHVVMQCNKSMTICYVYTKYIFNYNIKLYHTFNINFSLN